MSRSGLGSLQSTVGRSLVRAITGSALVVVVVVAFVEMSAATRAPSVPRLDDDYDAAPPKSDAKAPPSSEPRIVRLDHESQEKGGIAVAVPSAVPFQEQVRAYGTVLALDRLTPLYNAALTNAAQLQAAEAKQAESRAADARAQTLLKAFSTAKAQAETAAAAAQIDSAGVATAKAQIEALRNTAIQDWGLTLGLAIVSRARLATDLVTRQTCLVQLSLQPGAAAEKPLDRLAFSLAGSRPLEGRFVSEAAQIDPKIGTIGYLYTVPAAPGLLPGASIIATLPEGAAKAGVGIPPSAVVWQAGKPWVYLRVAPERFERRAIDGASAPTADGGYVVPRQGFATPGDKGLVVAGAQVLLSQEMHAQIPSDEDDP